MIKIFEQAIPLKIPQNEQASPLRLLVARCPIYSNVPPASADFHCTRESQWSTVTATAPANNVSESQTFPVCGTDLVVVPLLDLSI